MRARGLELPHAFVITHHSFLEREAGMAEIDLILEGWSVNLDQGNAAFCGVTLVRGPSKTILVDVAHVGRRALLVDNLATMGLTPADIDTVVLTHSHWDHILNADVFKNAEFLLHPLEIEYAQSPHPNDWATPGYTWSILERCNIREVREGDEVDHGISVIATPGHTRGSISIVVNQPDGSSVICGDALPTVKSALDGCPYLVFWDESDARQSARKILDSGDVLYPGHDRPFRIEHGRAHYIQPPSRITVNAGLDPGAEPVAVTLAPGASRGLRLEGLAAERRAAQESK
jgi:glyoxylase-like metal-dependent hydrolase (beta-lactamase superfamily II)